YKLSDPEIKQHKRWFWGYLLFATVFYTEYKNTIARVSHIKEWVGERSWKVTPRSDNPADTPTFDPDAVDAEAASPDEHEHRVGPIDSGVVDRIDRELVALLTAGATVIEAPDEVLRAG